MAELRIPIVVENKGKKAFKDVDKSVKGLASQFKKLAGAAGIGLSTAAVINFGKEAAKAFIEDEKSARRLAMSVKNLGLGFETPRIERYISELSAMSGITDDQLRPSMQKLLQTTGSVTKSQELLTQALDISRGSGVDYETVISDLTAAYLGQTKGISKYSLGLSKAELKTMSFAEIQKKLTDQFKGANADYLETYAGKMEVLNTAAGEAKETIGKGLVDALSLLAGEGNTVQPLADSMAEFGTYVGDAIVGVAVLIDKLNKIPGMGKQNALSEKSIFLNPTVSSLAIFKKALDYVSKTGAEYQALNNQVTMGYLGSMPVGIYPTSDELAKQRQLEAERIKREKELAALQKKSLADAAKKARLESAARKLDLQRININAALKGKISETDKLSLQLQLALLNENDTEAKKLSDQLDAAIKRQKELEALLLATPKARNPYEDWKVPTFDYGGNLLGSKVPNFVPPSFMTPDFIGGMTSNIGPQAQAAPQVNITVELDGQAVGGAIRDTQINDSLAGSFSQTNRFAAKGAIAI